MTGVIITAFLAGTLFPDPSDLVKVVICLSL
jgi:membrane protein YqaA with SNARE-associated domain